MKKYNSPVCEIEIFTMSDVVTASKYQEFYSSNIGNLDDGGIDKIIW